MKILPFRSVGKSGERYPHWLNNYRESCGVYIIKHKRRIVYIGESHTGRLKKTLTRHFQRWERRFNRYDTSGWNDHTGQVYNREECKVSLIITGEKDAVKTQYEKIKELKPRDNQCTGQCYLSDCDAIPF